jgi:hypothetical protein
MQRHVLLACVVLATACQLFEQKPAEAPAPAPELVPAEGEPAPLPPEETAPPEEPAPAPAAEAKPVEPGVTSTGTPPRGKLPKAIIDAQLKAAQPDIMACYERSLKTTPGLRGNVSIDFVVMPDGKVGHAEAMEVDDALTHPGTIDCILGVMKKLEFPQPQGGRVFINYPLKLEAPQPAPG